MQTPKTEKKINKIKKWLPNRSCHVASFSTTSNVWCIINNRNVNLSKLTSCDCKFGHSCDRAQVLQQEMYVCILYLTSHTLWKWTCHISSIQHRITASQFRIFLGTSENVLTVNEVMIGANPWHIDIVLCFLWILASYICWCAMLGSKVCSPLWNGMSISLYCFIAFVFTPNPTISNHCGSPTWNQWNGSRWRHNTRMSEVQHHALFFFFFHIYKPQDSKTKKYSNKIQKLEEWVQNG